MVIMRIEFGAYLLQCGNNNVANNAQMFYDSISDNKGKLFCSDKLAGVNLQKLVGSISEIAPQYEI